MQFCSVPSFPFSKISVVMQGPVVPQTASCLASIRKHLPQSQIILSTWQGSDVSGLDYDILVLNDEPGSEKCNFSKNIFNNQNRQLVSTQAGIAKATGKYILKIRTDFSLRSARFLEYWNAFPLQDEKTKIFSHRCVISSIYSRLFSNSTKLPMPFHPSDFFMFGLAEDLKGYYNSIPLATKEELGNWKFLYPDRKPYVETHRYTPEQFFFFSYVKTKFPKVQFEDWTDFSEENISFSNDILFNNFIFLDYKQSGIYCEKFSEKLKNPDAIYGIISFAKFQEEYKARYDNSYVFKSDKLSECFRQRVKNHAEHFCKPLKSFLKWLLRPAAIILNCVVFILAKLKIVKPKFF